MTVVRKSAGNKMKLDDIKMDTPIKSQNAHT